MFQKVKVDYDFSRVLNADYNQHCGSCIVHQAKEMPDIYKGGQHVPTYCDENTAIHQLWWSRDDLDYDELGRQLNMEIVSISSIRQDPGNVIPYHRDMFHKITTAYPDRQELKVRANFFLENSKIGHFLQFTLDDGTLTAADWQPNEGYMFDSTILHLSANAGLEPKYTLQISGFYLGQEQ